MFLLMWCSPRKPTTAAPSIQAHLSFISDKMTGGDQLYWVIWLIVVNLRGVKGQEHYAAGVELHQGSPASRRERLYTKETLLQGGRGFISKQPAARLSKASPQSKTFAFKIKFVGLNNSNISIHRISWKRLYTRLVVELLGPDESMYTKPETVTNRTCHKCCIIFNHSSSSDDQCEQRQENSDWRASLWPWTLWSSPA